MKNLKNWLFETGIMLLQVFAYISTTFLVFRVFYDTSRLEYSLFYEYFRYVYSFFTLQWGLSWNNIAISFYLGPALFRTMIILFPSLLLAFFFSYQLAVNDYLGRFKLLLRFLQGFLKIFSALPIYWLTFLLIALAVRVPFLPTGGTSSAMLSDDGLVTMLADRFRFLILPWLNMLIFPTLILSSSMHHKIKELERRDFVRTAKAFGFTKKKLLSKHLRAPILSDLFLNAIANFPLFMTYLIFTEIIFDYNGIGLYCFFSRDPYMSQIAVVYLGVFSLLTQFLLKSIFVLFVPKKDHDKQKPQNKSFPWVLWFFAVFFGYLLTESLASQTHSVWALLQIAGIVTAIILLLFVPFSAKIERQNLLGTQRISARRMKTVFKEKFRINFSWKILIYILFFLGLAGIFTASWFYRSEPLAALRHRSPSQTHWMGTDTIGYDYFIQVFSAARFLVFPVAAALFSAIAGTFLGVLAGIFKLKALDSFISYLEMFPSLILLVLVAPLSGYSVYGLMATLLIVGSLRFYRIISTEVETLRKKEYFMYGQFLKSSILRLFRRHIYPVLKGRIVYQFFFLVADMLIIQANFAFFVRYFSSNTPEFSNLFPVAGWGALLANCKAAILRGHWWLILFPAVLIFVYVIFFRGLGSALKNSIMRRTYEN